MRCDLGAVERQDNAILNGGFERDSNSDDTPDNIFSDPVMPVRGGQVYSFTGWVNIPATADTFSFELQVRRRDASANVISTVPVRTWTAATNDCTSANATQATIRQVVSGSNGTIDVDDLFLEP